MNAKTSLLLLIILSSGGCVGQNTGPLVISNHREYIIEKTVLRDNAISLNFAYALNPDCTSRGEPVLQILAAPTNGAATISKSRDYTNFVAPNERVACNTVKRDGTRLTYKPNPGYVGPDSVTADTVYPSGQVQHIRYAITVR